MSFQFQRLQNIIRGSIQEDGKSSQNIFGRNPLAGYLQRTKLENKHRELSSSQNKGSMECASLKGCIGPPNSLLSPDSGHKIENPFFEWKSEIDIKDKNKDVKIDEAIKNNESARVMEQTSKRVSQNNTEDLIKDTGQHIYLYNMYKSSNLRYPNMEMFLDETSPGDELKDSLSKRTEHQDKNDIKCKIPDMDQCDFSAIEVLMNALIFPLNNDTKYPEFFFSTYKFFTSANIVLTYLIEMYKMPSNKATKYTRIFTQSHYRIKMRVVQCLCIWVKQSWIDFCDRKNVELYRMLTSLANDEENSEIVYKLKRVIEEQKMLFFGRLCMKLPLNLMVITPNEQDPVEYLKNISSEKFAACCFSTNQSYVHQIPLRSYLDLIQVKHIMVLENPHPELELLFDYINWQRILGVYILNSLMESTPKNLPLYLNRIFSIIKHLWRFNDFPSLSAFLWALKSPKIAHLIEFIDKDVKFRKMLSQVESIFDSENNYEKYWKHISTLKEYIIPYMTPHISEVISVFRKEDQHFGDGKLNLHTPSFMSNLKNNNECRDKMIIKNNSDCIERSDDIGNLKTGSFCSSSSQSRFSSLSTLINDSSIEIQNLKPKIVFATRDAKNGTEFQNKENLGDLETSPPSGAPDHDKKNVETYSEKTINTEKYIHMYNILHEMLSLSGTLIDNPSDENMRKQISLPYSNDVLTQEPFIKYIAELAETFKIATNLND